MFRGGIPQIVHLVNRVVDSEGRPVPRDYYYDGEAVKISDALDVPWDVARVFVHQSMFRFGAPSEYRLGCAEFGLPTTPFFETDLPDELIDRPNMPGKVVRRVIPNLIQRTEPLTVGNPGRGDGAFPGTFGERVH